jgi:glutamyl-Q tRNA(Asp) synthetase
MPEIKPTKYIGRFAPSPTGPVHFGTLVAAVGSYLQAKVNDGKWLVRIEDVDITRRVAGADSEILKTLEHFGFEWDDEVVYQSMRTELYEHALNQLIAISLVYPCLCSRKQLSSNESSIYPGTCRLRSLPEAEEHALRVRTDDREITFTDLVMGNQQQNMLRDCGDFIIKRRDGLFAYQLAVVVDDAMQGVTQIVRGADLLDSTARQIYLQQLLEYPTPEYCHLPLATDADGNKISKSEGAARIDKDSRSATLSHALDFLGQKPPRDLCHAELDETWRWASEHWDIRQVPKVPDARFY